MSVATAPALDNKALDALFAGRHTTNFFADVPVDPALVRESYEDARWAPTSMNTQPLRITVLQKGQTRDAVVEHMMEGNRAKTAAAPLTVVAAFDPDWHEHMDTLFPAIPGSRRTSPPSRRTVWRWAGTTPSSSWATCCSRCAPTAWRSAR